jgi:hypothetical protein
LPVTTLALVARFPVAFALAVAAPVKGEAQPAIFTLRARSKTPFWQPSTADPRGERGEEQIGESSWSMIETSYTPLVI